MAFKGASTGAGRRRTCEKEDGGGEEAHHNESRLPRQAERGGAGQCTSHSRPRSRRNPYSRIYVCMYVYVATPRTKCGRDETPRIVIRIGIYHCFFGMYDGTIARARRCVTSISVWPRLFIARHCDGQAIIVKITMLSFLLLRNI